MGDAAGTDKFHPEQAPMALDRTAGWAYFRAAGDVVEGDGAWFLTSADAVQYAHHHPELFSSARAFDSIGSPLPLIPLAIDPPEHVRYRRVLDPMLAPRVVNAMEDELRRQIAELIDGFAARGGCEVMADVARLYPTQVFLTLFGLPLADRDRFIAWVDVINGGASLVGDAPNPEVLEAALAMFGYLQDAIAAKRAAPGEDMLSRILALSGDDAWTEEELLGLCFLFTLAGLDTVTAAIGFVMLHLATNPELRRRTVADPTLVGPVIEEVLRLELPAPMTPRVTVADVEVGGHRIPAGCVVQLALAAANRDPSRFPTPDGIDLDQAERGHLAFGGGVHRCLGSHLARRELRLVVEEFHKRIPEYEVAPGVTPAVEWPAGTLHLTSLPLVFPARQAP
jgi:cytochrome P450